MHHCAFNILTGLQFILMCSNVVRYEKADKLTKQIISQQLITTSWKLTGLFI